MKSPLLQRPDYLVCTCMAVMYSDIIQAIHQGDNSYHLLQEKLLVGTGCSSCVEEVKMILEEEKNKIS
jgi:bacterioferritin-associated ferredoxin